MYILSTGEWSQYVYILKASVTDLQYIKVIVKIIFKSIVVTAAINGRKKNASAALPCVRPIVKVF